MTWTKLGDEYSDDLALAGLSDAAYRTHTEAIGWIYRVEAEDLRIPCALVRRFAGSDRAAEAIETLIAAGFWRDESTHYVVVHHADVIRQSLAAQQAKRDGDRERQRRHRDRKPREVTGGVTRDVTDDDAATQTDSQTSSRDEGTEFSATCIRCGKPSRRGCRTCWEHSGEEAS